jgi:hypothetical protein
MAYALLQAYYAAMDGAPLESIVRTFLWHATH